MQKYYKFCCAVIFNGIFFIFVLAAFKPFYSDWKTNLHKQMRSMTERGVSNRSNTWKGQHLQPLLVQNFIHKIKTSESARLTSLFHKFICIRPPKLTSVSKILPQSYHEPFYSLKETYTCFHMKIKDISSKQGELKYSNSLMCFSEIEQ